jgi:hypothetical protein
MSHTPWNDPPSRRSLTIPFTLSACWTPDQALAVFELLDDLREHIAAHYAFQLTEAMRESSFIHTNPPIDLADDTEPF